ncbi:hypothetical protein BGX34_001680 [Mortierella sp. NVP85]|nr:hypothetical protein BGX34_001680 [Mortierella sp. NVP85]
MVKASFTFIAVAALAVFSTFAPQEVEAHSWLDCVDWRWKKSSGKNKDWRSSAGYCKGYARRYPANNPRAGKFGLLDNTEWARHYRQNLRKDTLPCSDSKHGLEKGIVETRDLKGSYGGKWGPMTVTKSGGELCVRWPGKNHAAANELETKVIINLAEKPGNDPTQSQLNKMKIAELRYKNCNKLGDSGKRDENTRPCGGCFKLPKRRPGIYLLQFRWRLNQGKNPLDDEIYTSCADIQIK